MARDGEPGKAYLKGLSCEKIRIRAGELGFDLIGFVPVGKADAPRFAAFSHWLQQGMHGEMAYLARDPERRRYPQVLLPGCQTVIMVGASYDQLHVPMDVLRDPARGRIARYAWGADYHDTLTPRLRQLGDFVSANSRAYVDTGAVLERAWAERAGLGFIGKNTCLINRGMGSYLFLGAILAGEVLIDEDESGAPAELQMNMRAQPKKAAGCGACTRCMTACPTGALRAPYQLDARLCISYLTIELKGSIPIELREQMENWIFGCDICQDVCPYVRRMERSRATDLPSVSIEVAAPRLVDVLALDKRAFGARFKGTPIMRAKRRGLLRNACVAAGNYGGREVVEPLRALLVDEEPMVREHAAWALGKIGWVS